jgi:hypothetical protein
MSNYTKTTNFLAKDSLPENDSGKIIKGSEFDTEFNALQTAIITKADLASPALTGVPTAATATAGTSTTQLATTAFVTAADTAILAANNTFTGTQTFKDNKFEVVDDSDATKKLNLQLSGITTATTRTLTVPDKNGTIATTADLIQGAPLNTDSNTIVSGSYAVTSSTTITITATNTFAVGQTVYITFTNTSGSALTAGDFTIVTASGGSFTITYGSSVTSAGTCVTTRYGLISVATSTDATAASSNTKAITPATLKAGLNASGSAPIFAPRAWVSFDALRDSSGATTTANTNRFIYGSGNVTSVLKTATGTFTITFTTDLPDANYAVISNTGATGTNVYFTTGTVSGTLTTSSFQILTGSGDTGNRQDRVYNSVVVFK